MSRRTILYVQHTFVLGGSAMSLLYLLQQLDRTRFEPVVACLYDAPEVVELYRSHGFRTVVVGGEMFSHTTGGWWPLTNPLGAWRLGGWLARHRAARRRLVAVAREVHADLVHLNSLTLAPFASALRRAGFRVVLHVRESVEAGHLGLRRAQLRRLAGRCDEVIFICEHDRERLGAGPTGQVVYNFVDFERFDRTLDRGASREALGIPADARVVLFAGGISRIKGILPLLRALHRLRPAIPGLLALFPGAALPARSSGAGALLRRGFTALGWRSGDEDAARALYERERMEAYVRLMPFSGEMPALLAAADVVAFPSLEPHFARPVMEAGAMARPVVASDIGGVREIVEHGVTGLLVPPGDVEALADALGRLLRDESGGASARGMGERAYALARERFDAARNARQTVAVYERLLGDRVVAAGGDRG